MQKQIEDATNWLKELTTVKGCITGSSLLGYFPDSKQDIDLFVYDEKSFTEVFYAMHYNPMFQILEDIENWKAMQFRTKNNDYKKNNIVTIKFLYNTCIEINIIYKKKSSDIFSVLSSFDMDIIAKGYDLETKQILDLSGNPGMIASWNKWNTSFYDAEIWEISRILRQLERCFKYYKRGYNTDPVVLKYIELIDRLQNYTNIFNSDNFSNKLKITQDNTLIVRQVCEKWLETHEITDEQIELLKIKIKEI